MLSSHFHLQLEVPRKPDEPPPLNALIARLELLSSAADGAPATRQMVARRTAAGAEYRKWIFGQGEERAGNDEAGQPLRRGFDRAAGLAVLAQGGTLGRAEMMRLRVRYLVDGAVPGSRAFVKDLFTRHRERLGPKRPDGARAMRGLPGLSALRALRLRVIT